MLCKFNPVHKLFIYIFGRLAIQLVFAFTIPAQYSR